MAKMEDRNPLENFIDSTTLLSVSFSKVDVCKDFYETFQERYPHLKPKYMLVNPDLRSMVDFVFIYEYTHPENNISIYGIFVANLYTVMGTNGFKVIKDSHSKKLMDLYWEEFFKASCKIPAKVFPSMIGEMEYEVYSMERPIYNAAIAKDLKDPYYINNTKRIIYEKGYSDKLDEKTMAKVLEQWPEDINVTNWYYSQRLSTNPKDEFYFANFKCLPTFFRSISRQLSDYNIKRAGAQGNKQ